MKSLIRKILLPILAAGAIKNAPALDFCIGAKYVPGGKVTPVARIEDRASFGKSPFSLKWGVEKSGLDNSPLTLRLNPQYAFNGGYSLGELTTYNPSSVSASVEFGKMFGKTTISGSVGGYFPIGKGEPDLSLTAYAKYKPSKRWVVDASLTGMSRNLSKPSIKSMIKYTL